MALDFILIVSTDVVETVSNVDFDKFVSLVPSEFFDFCEANVSELRVTTIFLLFVLLVFLHHFQVIFLTRNGSLETKNFLF